MNISLLEPIGVSKEKINELANVFTQMGHHFTYYHQKTTDISELIKRSENQDIIMIANNPYPREVVTSTNNLKMISVAFTGIDHIDTELCKEKNITICNCAGYADESVAELTIGMAISALRNIAVADKETRKGATNINFCGREIMGKTIGIIGLGKIGFRTAQLFKAFGAKIIAYNRSQNPEYSNLEIEYQPLDVVLHQSDIISLNLPLTPSTKGLISAEKISLMKKNAIFINCARGPIVDNHALADALNLDQIGYACIDVFAMEPPIPNDYPLLHSKHTLLTPHIAFMSEESMIRRADILFHNVVAYLNNEPINICD